MSRRRQIAQKMDNYTDVRSILVAMKNIALMEVHKLGLQIELQNNLLETITRVTEDFNIFYPLTPTSGPNICITIGAERGFCGTFNTALTEPLLAASKQGDEILIIGSRLAEQLVEMDNFDALSGATIIEEVPMVLEQIADWLEQRQAQSPGMPLNVKVLYNDETTDQPLFKTIVPLPVRKHPEESSRNKPVLTLDPPEFLSALIEQSLILSLKGYLMLSLAAENRKRFVHMNSALRRLDEKRSSLERKMNAARQEDIIQEIETIMLGSLDSQ